MTWQDPSPWTLLHQLIHIRDGLLGIRACLWIIIGLQIAQLAVEVGHVLH